MTLRQFNTRLLPLGIAAVVLMAFCLLQTPSVNSGGRLVSYQGHKFTIFVADPAQHQVQLHYTNAQGKRYESIQSLLKTQQKVSKKVLMITNAGMFKPNHTPVGLFIQGGKTLFPIDTSNGKGNFYLKPNGVFAISANGAAVFPTEQWQNHSGAFFATQSGPMLVIDGAVHPAFQPSSSNTYIRSGVGVDSLGRVVFSISNEPVNLHTFASLFKEQLHCANALYLDGAISLMYLPPIRNDLGGEFGPLIMVTEK